MKINQKEILELATPKKKVVTKKQKLSKEEQIYSYIKKHGKVGTDELFKAILLSGHAKEITENMAFRGLIKITPCGCGRGHFYELT